MTTSKFLLTFLIYVTVCLTVSNGLECYVCEYIEDLQNPGGCKDSPDTSVLLNIDDVLIPGGYRVSGRNRLVSARNSNSMAVASSVVLSVSDRQAIRPGGYYPYKYCVKYTGKEVSTGREVTRRLGIGLKNNGGIRSGCQDYLPDGVQLPDLTDTHICFCDTHGCNGAKTLIMAVSPIFLAVLSYVLSSF